MYRLFKSFFTEDEYEFIKINKKMILKENKKSTFVILIDLLLIILDIIVVCIELYYGTIFYLGLLSIVLFLSWIYIIYGNILQSLSIKHSTIYHNKRIINLINQDIKTLGLILKSYNLSLELEEDIDEQKLIKKDILKNKEQIENHKLEIMIYQKEIDLIYEKYKRVD